MKTKDREDTRPAEPEKKSAQATDYDFIREQIKERPVNRKKIFRRMLFTAGMAVLFATIACITFLLLEPVFHLTSYIADVKDMGDYVPETEAIKTAGGVTYFDESAKRSAPYFDLRIDGINLLNSGF